MLGHWPDSTVAKSKWWLNKVWAVGGFSFLIKVGLDPGGDVSGTPPSSKFRVVKQKFSKSGEFTQVVFEVAGLFQFRGAPPPIFKKSGHSIGSGTSPKISNLPPPAHPSILMCTLLVLTT